MSFSLAGAINVVGGLIAKKSAEVAAVSGSLLASAGILLGAHGLSSLNQSQDVRNRVQNGHQVLQEKQVRFTQMERRLRVESRKITAQTASACVTRVTDACTLNHQVAYHHLIKNERAVTFDLPHWAAENGITLTAFLSPGSSPISGPGGAPNGGQPVPGYPGIEQMTFHVGGTYQTLEGLRHFVGRLPVGVELTSISIQKNTFQAGITAYGLSA